MKNRAWIILSCIVVALGILVTLLIKRCVQNGENLDLPMEETMASIEEVRPRGEIYVCSAMIEDYTTKRATEHNLIFPNEEHSCVQTMRQKCSYKIDLDKVIYQRDDSLNLVYVKLPPIEYVASTQSSTFLSDDANYWAEHLPNTNEMKKKVEAQIKRRFDTPSNKRQAERYAEDAISQVLSQLGYEVEFVRALQQRRD